MVFNKIFGSKPEKVKIETPSIMGLRIGCSFEVDTLLLKLVEPELMVSGSNPTHIIKAAGKVELDGTTIFRFYTDDDAFLQVVSEGGTEESHVVDVKLFHFYDTLDIPSQDDWDRLLWKEMGGTEYSLENYTYSRVWTSAGDYHNPVHMLEKTYDVDGVSQTDQFVMLFERPISNDNTESLMLSAEETEEIAGNLSRCLVLSTGISLSPSQINIHG